MSLLRELPSTHSQLLGDFLTARSVTAYCTVWVPLSPFLGPHTVPLSPVVQVWRDHLNRCGRKSNRTAAPAVTPAGICAAYRTPPARPLLRRADGHSAASGGCSRAATARAAAAPHLAGAAGHVCRGCAICGGNLDRLGPGGESVRVLGLKAVNCSVGDACV